MFKKMRKAKYEICVPPLKKPFHEFRHNETEEYFHWHMSHIDERIDCLSAYVSRARNIQRAELDLSPQSLVHVWSWFLSVAETESVPPSGLTENDEKNLTQIAAFRRYTVEQAQGQYTFETELILMDIGMYLGQVFVRNNPGIYWSYYEKPKSDFFVNMPLLLGFEDSAYAPPFKMAFEPVHMSRVQAARIWDGSQKKEDLFNLYIKWSGSYVPHI